jgi:Rha family phage regulatory protein
VLRDLSAVIAQCPAHFNAINFEAVEFTDAKGEQRPAYRITRDGFTLLAMGFTGKRALAFKLAYIEAFNKMEAALRGAAFVPPKPVPPPTQFDRQLIELANLLAPLSPTSRKEWISFTRGFAMGCASHKPHEMAYL